MVTEPREDEDEYTVPCHSYMRPGLKRASVAWQNISEKPQTINKGTVVAQIQAANLIPLKLAPRFSNINSINANQSSEPSPEQIEKLFKKVDISGAEEWSEENWLKLRQLFIKHHNIFALDDLEFGKTDMVKHVIKLNDDKPFCEWYRRIPPHQYNEVKKHLKELLEIGVIIVQSCCYIKQMVPYVFVFISKMPKLYLELKTL